MLEKFDEKIQTLVHALHEEGFVIKGIRNGIRVKLETGADIDIYALKSDSSHIRARLKLTCSDEHACNDTLNDISMQLQKGFGHAAIMENFRLTKHEDGVMSFYARIKMGGNSENATLRLESSSGRKSDHRVIEKGNFEFSSDLEATIELLDTVDSKKFRQALDDLGLPRSSLLRVVLTRIFRAAADPEELKMVIEEEAERITDPQDLLDLAHINSSNTIDFLSPVLKMLHQYSCG